ncbi:hypothetical protein TNIN_103381 [Trichonephila inaurata madagascariensis]|uniref:Uncharacterized protein n=1 Tax=Trichonephila inaurata madagascariensis TaxID=2747483 RepID=A0A8X7BNT3_9ARAC|nr:hypothetical protein TNIN_103381 [Trichonephila inaurata madagascariensis]
MEGRKSVRQTLNRIFSLTCFFIRFSSRYHYQQLIRQIKDEGTHQEMKMHFTHIRAKRDSVTTPEQPNHAHQNCYEGRKGKVVVQFVHTFHDVSINTQQVQ